MEGRPRLEPSVALSHVSALQRRCATDRRRANARAVRPNIPGSCAMQDLPQAEGSIRSTRRGRDGRRDIDCSSTERWRESARVGVSSLVTGLPTYAEAYVSSLPCCAPRPAVSIHVCAMSPQPRCCLPEHTEIACPESSGTVSCYLQKPRTADVGSMVQRSRRATCPPVSPAVREQLSKPCVTSD